LKLLPEFQEKVLKVNPLGQLLCGQDCAEQGRIRLCRDFRSFFQRERNFVINVATGEHF
jgi:hypothetical protein